MLENIGFISLFTCYGAEEPWRPGRVLFQGLVLRVAGLRGWDLQEVNSLGTAATGILRPRLWLLVLM